MKKLIALLLLAVLLSACTGRYVQTPDSAVRLSHDKAVEIALRIASTSRPEFGPSTAAPTNIDARLMQIQKAYQELSITSSLPQGYQPSTAIWLVTMDGSWEGATAPGPTPGTQFYKHCAFILNIDTGDLVTSVCRS